jgi:hypothetical protein
MLSLGLGLGLGACAERALIEPTNTGPIEPAKTALIGPPKYRVGVLPFPGMFSALAIPDPDKLGEHRYEGVVSPLSPEQARGLVYTCDAGFLDLAHVRKSIDWSRYLALQIEEALTRGADEVTIGAEEPSRYHLTFRYPQFWDGLDPAEKQVLIDELSIRLGQHISELASTWHEMISFYGYSLNVFYSEKRSAFTYDDMTSHLVGAEVAGIAMRDKTRNYDAAVTHALQQELARLRVVSAEETKQALHKVKGLWWEGFFAIKRDLQIALDNEAIVPWIVRDLSFCPDARPVPFSLADLKDVHGRDFTGFVDLAIEPRVSDAAEILAMFSPKPQVIRPEQHFPTIMANIRKALVEEYGEDVDKPYP